MAVTAVAGTIGAFDFSDVSSNVLDVSGRYGGELILVSYSWPTSAGVTLNSVPPRFTVIKTSSGQGLDHVTLAGTVAGPNSPNPTFGWSGSTVVLYRASAAYTGAAFPATSDVYTADDSSSGTAFSFGFGTIAVTNGDYMFACGREAGATSTGSGSGGLSWSGASQGTVTWQNGTSPASQAAGRPVTGTGDATSVTHAFTSSAAGVGHAHLVHLKQGRTGKAGLRVTSGVQVGTTTLNIGTVNVVPDDLVIWWAFHKSTATGIDLSLAVPANVTYKAHLVEGLTSQAGTLSVAWGMANATGATGTIALDSLVSSSCGSIGVWENVDTRSPFILNDSGGRIKTQMVSTEDLTADIGSNDSSVFSLVPSADIMVGVLAVDNDVSAAWGNWIDDNNANPTATGGELGDNMTTSGTDCGGSWAWMTPTVADLWEYVQVQLTEGGAGTTTWAGLIFGLRQDVGTLPNASTLTDDFATTIDDAKWRSFTQGGSLSISNGELSLSCTGAGSYAGVISVDPYNLDSAYLRITQLPPDGASYLYFHVGPEPITVKSGVWFKIYPSGGIVEPRWLNSSDVEQGGSTFTITAGHYLKFDADSTNVYLRSSSDGSSWTLRTTIAKANLGYDYFDFVNPSVLLDKPASAGTATAKVDNYNTTGGLSGDDAGIGTEAATVSVTLSAADTGTGTEALGRAAADTGSGLDVFTVAAEVTLADTGTGTEAVTGLDRTVADSGTGTEDHTVEGAAIPKDGADAGAGTEAASVAVEVSASDAGTGSEAVLERAATGADSATGTEQASLAVAVAGADTGTGSTPTETVYQEYGELGVGTESASVDTGGADKTGDDTGTGTDAWTVTVEVSAADAAAGTDAWTATAEFAAAETGTGTESAAPAAELPAQADAGTGTEAAGPPAVAHAQAETGGGADAASPDVGLPTQADAGTGTETGEVQIGLVDKTGDDTGTGTDEATLAVAHAATETAAGTDAWSVAVEVAASDTGTGADATAERGLAAADTGTGTDAWSLAAAVSLSDAGSGTDATGGRALAQADAGAGTDAWSLAAALAAADTATGTDDATAQVTAADLTGADTGAGTESASLAVEVSASDGGTGAEAVLGANVPVGRAEETDEALPIVALVAKPAQADAGTGTETAAAAAAVAAADTGTGTDAAAVAAAIAASDGGTGTELGFTGEMALERADTGTGTDAASVAVEQPAQTDTGTGTDTWSVAVGAATTEAGTGTEQAAPEAAHALADAGAGTEQATVAVQVLVADAGTGTQPSEVLYQGFGEAGTGTESAEAGPVVHQVAVGTAEETDTARPISLLLGGQLGQPLEQDEARPLTAVRAVPVGQATETDEATPVGRDRAYGLGQAAETDEARPVGVAVARGVGQVEETDEALPLQHARTVQVGVAEETDEATHASPVRAYPLGQAEETEQARPVGSRHRRVIGAVGELDRAGTVTRRLHRVNRATELDTALQIKWAVRLTVGRAEETDEALPLVRHGLATVHTWAQPRDPAGGDATSAVLVTTGAAAATPATGATGTRLRTWAAPHR